MCGRSSWCEMRWCAGAGCWSKRRGRSCARSPRRPPRCARGPCRSRSDAASAGNSLTHHGPSTSSDSWRRPLFRTHPTAPGPSRPSRAREQKAEQHLEDRSDHQNSCSGKPSNSVWGLDAGGASRTEFRLGWVERRRAASRAAGSRLRRDRRGRRPSPRGGGASVARNRTHEWPNFGNRAGHRPSGRSVQRVRRDQRARRRTMAAAMRPPKTRAKLEGSGTTLVLPPYSTK